MGRQTEGSFLPVVGSVPFTAETRDAGGVPAEVFDEFLELIKTGYGRHKAADLLGYRWSEIADALQGRDDLRDAYEHATAVRLDEVEEALYGAAVAGNFAAQKFVLTNRRAGTWGDGPVLVERVRAAHAPEEDEQSQLETQRARDAFRNVLMERIENAREMAARARESEDSA